MFVQDYDIDDELSGDDRGRSPRGAGGYATRAAENAERRIADGREPMDFGGRRRGQKMAPWMGQAFGAAPPPEKPQLAGLDTRGSKEKVLELRDYSSRSWRAGAAAAGAEPPSAVKRDAVEDKELALLTGRKGSAIGNLPAEHAPKEHVGQKEKEKEGKGKSDKKKKEKHDKVKKSKKHKHKKEKKKKDKKGKRSKDSSS
ncbi:Uap1 [Symbiodinium pilosum]|uniref:Uap1 protein n=1 Tax=Symbiodinium pilosum TaxID=2952 RepID=A0A812W9F0_SYMPI|nr:Uap1 [Symbiodinium pilosum]